MNQPPSIQLGTRKHRGNRVKWNLGSYGDIRELKAALEPRMTVRQVAEAMGLSRGAVLYIENSALRKILEGLRNPKKGPSK